MCRSATLLIVAAALVASAQTSSPDWRRVGNAALDLRLASVASGPVDRVWHNSDRLYVRTSAGRVFETTDYETWRAAANVEPPPPAKNPEVERVPEGANRLRTAGQARVYAAGSNAWRSDDGGAHWANLTGFQSTSILGDELVDLSVSPTNPNDIVVAGKTGVWRSLDGGQSWAGLNSGLPNLPLRRILTTPSGTQPLRIALDSAEALWRPGDKTGWTLADDRVRLAENARRAQLSEALALDITATAQSAEILYAGSSDGRLLATSNGGRNWRQFPAPGSGVVEAIAVDPRDPMFAVAAVTTKDRGRVFRTINGGVFWDDLADAAGFTAVLGVAVDRASGAVYAATPKGVWLSYGTGTWTSITAGLPDAPALDVKLNEGAHQLYAAVEGYGVYATLAPHRLRDPRVVSAGDLAVRAAAPGALLTVIGRAVESARAGDLPVPVLSSTPVQSQIQVPFEATGARLPVSLVANGGVLIQSLPLQRVAPTIFVDTDGSALITDAESGLLLDASSPVKPNGRLQIFATGLGRVRPDWPTGAAAPMQDSPQVIAPVRVYLDRQPVEVTRAILAPGYVGFYLIEVQVPAILNDGSSELYLEVDGQESNRVKLYTQQ